MSKIVVAIDLGTSRSAWAFSIKGRAEGDIIVRIPEKSLSSVSGMKTETAVLLDSETGKLLAFGRSARETFVHQTEDDEVHLDEGGQGGKEALKASSTMLFRCFKVALCEKRGYQSIHEPFAAAEGGQKKLLLHVVSAALRHFKDDIVEHLSSVSGVPQTVGDLTWVLTIPAIYDDFAKRFMRHAAFEAGIIPSVDSEKLQLCLEPEAACLAMGLKEAALACQPGANVMIVDCGGGTVDITAHEVVSTGPLRLKELVPPTGGPWGSTCVDEAFKEWLELFMGKDNFYRMRHLASFYTLMLQWEDGKTRFTGAKQDTVRINLGEVSRCLDIRASDMKGLRAAYNGPQESEDLCVTGAKFLVILPSPVVMSFFSPTIERIGTCLGNLKNSDALRYLSHVFLVGGFSSSPLVQSISREKLQGHGCTVVSALRPDVAIVRGAVLFASNAAVFASRKARLTYGVIISEKYQETNPGHVKHYSQHRAAPGHDGERRIFIFSRHISFGDDIPHDGACDPQPYVPLFPSQTRIKFDIMASNKRNIEFPDKNDCFKVGKVNVPMDMDIPFHKRLAQVQFSFGGSEISVTAINPATGDKGEATVSMIQEVEAL